MSDKKKLKPQRVRWDMPTPSDYLPPVLYYPEVKTTIYTDNPDQYHRFYENSQKGKK